MERSRTDLLNLICEIRKPKRYLEIGIQKGENFKAVNCPVKIGVDPNPDCFHPDIREVTSDTFFHKYPFYSKFDLIFIDGDHSAEQTEKDIDNALDYLSKGGLIVCHDALPHSLEYTGPEWCGTAYKAIMSWACNPGTECITWEGDHGCTIFRVTGEVPDSWTEFPATTFENLWANDAAIVNKSTWEEVEEWLRKL